MEIEEIKDSPGLAVDIAFVASFHTRFVLDAIARRLTERPNPARNEPGRGFRPKLCAGLCARWGRLCGAPIWTAGFKLV